MTFYYWTEISNDMIHFDHKLSKMLLGYFEQHYFEGDVLKQNKTHKGCVLYSGKYRFIYDWYDSHVVVYRILT